MRKTKEELEQLKQKYNTDVLWSFSKINNFTTCCYCYYLKYIKKEKELDDSTYAILGNNAHDILERLYNNEIKYEDMINEFDGVMLSAELNDMKFDRYDNDKNENIKNKYTKCLQHFFQNHIPVKSKCMTEEFIVINVNNNYFQGYVDFIHKEDDTYIITDFKTSTIYTGQKIQKEGKQLILYALGLHQKKVPLDKIKIRWNFLKYNSVTFTLKNGKEKTMNCERYIWVGSIKSYLRRNLKDLGYDENEAEIMLDKCINDNDISSLPKEIQDLYSIDDCYVYIEFNQDAIDNLVNDLTETIEKIKKKEKQFEIMNDDIIFNREILDKDSYFCLNLCGFNSSQCRLFKEYLENRDMFKDKGKGKSDDDVLDMDWMKEIGLV